MRDEVGNYGRKKSGGETLGKDEGEVSKIKGVKYEKRNRWDTDEQMSRRSR